MIKYKTDNQGKVFIKINKINAAINILFEGINNELAKIESNPFANSSEDLNNYKNNYRISKVVDGIILNQILDSEFKETSPFMVGDSYKQ